jgi:glutamate/tyrosine decarboxylase-like PLP-dependent enzyme
MSIQFDTNTLRLLESALSGLDRGFSGLPESSFPPADSAKIKKILLETAERLQDNFPYFHPLYAGQMLKPPHPVARLAYELALHINPNNHALDGGRASSAMEKEAVAQLARMVGWETHLGHLCSGGTIANLEALWIARELKQGNVVLASGQAHYTQRRMCGLLGVEFETIPCTSPGQMDVALLEKRLERGNVGAVVATLGTTGTGAVDPLPEIVALRSKHGFRLHVDAAYGGYFTLADNLSAETRRSFDMIGEADSIVIDPHKHGLQPYGCGCVLFRDPSEGRFYKHDSPYTYFSSSELHLGEISLECSRPGAAAVALWATQSLFPLVRGGEFARGLMDSRTAALEFYGRLAADRRCVTASKPELDIVAWIPRAADSKEASTLSRKIFDECARHDLHLALAELPVSFFESSDTGMAMSGPTVTALRSVLMKPEHLQWLDRIWAILDRATGSVLTGSSQR